MNERHDDKKQRALNLGQAIQGKAIAFPVKLVTDDDNDPSTEWFVDANGEHVDPYTIMLALNAFAPSATPPIMCEHPDCRTAKVPAVGHSEGIGNVCEQHGLLCLAAGSPYKPLTPLSSIAPNTLSSGAAIDHGHAAARDTIPLPASEDVKPDMALPCATSADRNSRPDHGIGEQTGTNRATQAGGMAPIAWMRDMGGGPSFTTNRVVAGDSTWKPLFEQPSATQPRGYIVRQARCQDRCHNTDNGGPACKGNECRRAEGSATITVDDAKHIMRRWGTSMEAVTDEDQRAWAKLEAIAGVTFSELWSQQISCRGCEGRERDLCLDKDRCTKAEAL